MRKAELSAVLIYIIIASLEKIHMMTEQWMPQNLGDEGAGLLMSHKNFARSP